MMKELKWDSIESRVKRAETAAAGYEGRRQ